MTRTLILEDFNQPAPPESSASHMTAPVAPATPVVPPAGVQPDADTGGLDAFEHGYQSGWDDCIANETEERRRIGADLGAALSSISLSEDAVRAELLTSLTSLMEDIATQLLPPLAAEAVIPVLINEITDVLAGHGPTELKLFAAPEKCASIEALVLTVTDMPVMVIAEPAFAEGQVSIRFADQRRDIDLSEAAERIASILRAFPQAAHGETHRDAGPTTMERGVA